jgi:hypothetical protein
MIRRRVMIFMLTLFINQPLKKQIRRNPIKIFMGYSCGTRERSQFGMLIETLFSTTPSMVRLFTSSRAFCTLAVDVAP